jgi:hypothetical protein
MKSIPTSLVTLSAALLVTLAAAPAVLAGDIVQITVHGEVDFNQINPAPLGSAQPGDPATLGFRVDSAVFVNSMSFPTRGYAIDKTSFTLDLDGTVVGLQNPFPAGVTPYFVIRNNDPGVDGLMLSTSVDGPVGVPLAQNGVFGAFKHTFYVTYGSALLPSLDIQDALGSYDFTGLSVFNWVVEDGGFEPLGLLFASLTIEVVPQTWTDKGSALAGVAGNPKLAGSGDLSGGSGNSLSLIRSAPNATAGLFLGFASTPVPFKGGTLLPFPFTIPLVLPTSPTGTITLTFTMPTGLPSDVELWLQWAIQDAAAVQGIALSNALLGVTP